MGMRGQVAILKRTCATDPCVGIHDEEVAIQDAIQDVVISRICIDTDVSVDHPRRSTCLGQVEVRHVVVEGVSEKNLLVVRARSVLSINEFDLHFEIRRDASGGIRTLDRRREDDVGEDEEKDEADVHCC